MNLHTNDYWFLFIKWLKYNKIFSKFFYYYQNNPFGWKNMWFKGYGSLKMTCVPRLYIFHAFDWASTKEGNIYWQNIDEQWESFYERINQIKYTQ